MAEHSTQRSTAGSSRSARHASRSRETAALAKCSISQVQRVTELRRGAKANKATSALERPATAHEWTFVPMWANVRFLPRSGQTGVAQSRKLLTSFKTGLNPVSLEVAAD